jgi:hypothetical protein
VAKKEHGARIGPGPGFAKREVEAVYEKWAGSAKGE